MHTANIATSSKTSAQKHLAARSTKLTLLLLLLLVAVPASAQSTITVGPSAGNQYQDLQAAINNAQPGDTLLLEAGAEFVGSFELPEKPGSTAYITIRTSAADSSLPAADVRITPAYASVLPKIVAPGRNAPAIGTASRASYYRFVGIEVTMRPMPVFTEPDELGNVRLNELTSLISLGSIETTDRSAVPHHIQFDRCYIHGQPASNLRRGIALNSADTDIVNSYISECHVIGQEAQAIGGQNGPGPFKIKNNYLEAAGENILIGGGDPRILELVPSDIEISGNHFFKPRKWRVEDPSFEEIPGAGSCVRGDPAQCRHWTVKNMLELKNARRVQITGNVLENVWADRQGGQGGTAVLFHPRNQEGTATWSTVEDVQFTNNIVRHAGGGISILSQDYNFQSKIAQRITINNNLLYDIGYSWGGLGFPLHLTNPGARDITFTHNTAVSSSMGIVAESNTLVTNFTVLNNIFNHHILFDGSAGVEALDRFATTGGMRTWDVRRNVIVAVPGNFQQAYPSDNYLDSPSFDAVGFADYANANYKLTNRYRGLATDNTADIGVALTLPSPWLSQDLGVVGTVGASSHLAGEYAVSGAGNISGTAGGLDALHFAYQADTGSSEIVARVARFDATTGAKAGVMLRMGLEANTPYAFLHYTGAGVVFLRRSGGGSVTTVGSLNDPSYKWLKLVRLLGKRRVFPSSTVTTERFSAYASSDGMTYTHVGSTSYTDLTTNTVNAGLAVSSGNTAALKTAVFDNVKVVP